MQRADNPALDGPVDPAATATFAHLFDALSDPSRLAILQHVASQEHRVRDLVEHLGFAQSTVSKHLMFLRQCGLLTVRSAGRASWFSLAQPERLAGLLAAAESLLAATGHRASLDSHVMAGHRDDSAWAPTAAEL